MASSKPVAVSSSGNEKGIWRDGNRLVVHKQAELPPICVKTNEPSARNIKRKYYWHHPSVFLAILINILIYVILALVLRKQHTLEVPVSEETASKRRNGIAIGWALSLSGVALFFGAMFFLLSATPQSNAAIGVVGLFLAAFLLIAGCIVGGGAAAVIQPKKMTESATWFKGAHSDYLARFPTLPPKA